MKFTRTHIIIAVSVLIVLVAMGVYFYKQGKKTVTIQDLPDDLPGNPGSNGTGTGGASNAEIKLIASGLYEDMNGYNAFGHNYEPYNQAITLSDTDIVKLYNTFNTLYQTESKETLKAWISGEWYQAWDIPNALLARFAKLNLQ